MPVAETYGTGLKDLGNQHAGWVEKEIVLHKPNLPPLLIKKRVLRDRRKTDDAVLAPLVFTVPNTAATQGATVQTLAWSRANPALPNFSGWMPVTNNCRWCRPSWTPTLRQ